VKAVEERCVPEARFDAVVEHERAISRSLGGRTVFDDRAGKRRGAVGGERLSLFADVC
jgi:uncharacterized protein